MADNSCTGRSIGYVAVDSWVDDHLYTSRWGILMCKDGHLRKQVNPLILAVIRGSSEALKSKNYGLLNSIHFNFENKLLESWKAGRQTNHIKFWCLAAFDQTGSIKKPSIFEF